MRQKTRRILYALTGLMLILGLFLQGDARMLYAQGDEEEQGGVQEEEEAGLRDADETDTERDLPTVELQDEEGNVLGEVDFVPTPRGRLLIELNAQEFDPIEQRLAIMDVGRCETPDFDTVGEEIQDLSNLRFFQDVDTVVGEMPAQEGATEEPADEDEETAVLGGLDIFGEPEAVELANLTGNATRFTGRTVRVEGPVATILDPADIVTDLAEANVNLVTFILESDEPRNNQVLVVTVEDVIPADELEVLENQDVTVTGVVVPFDIQFLEEQTDVDLVDEEVEEFEGAPLIIANSVQAAAAEEAGEEDNEYFAVLSDFDTEQLFDEDGSALVLHLSTSPRSDIVACGVIVPAEEEAEAVATPTTEEAALVEIAEDPEAFVGQRVTVRGPVSEQINPRAFRLEADGDEIAVLISGRLRRELEAGESLRVQGTVREFEREAIEEELGVELEDELVEELEGETVIVASSIRAGGALSRYILPGEDVFPEGIAFQPSTNDFFVSSTTDGAIYRGNLGEQEADVFLPGGEDGRTGAAGLAVDDEGHLFVSGGDTGRMFVYDISSGELIDRFDSGEDETFVNDVTVTDAGHAYFTDSFSPAIYRVSTDDEGELEFERWLDLTDTPIEYQQGFNVNGIVSTADGQYLIVVQSNTGNPYRINTDTEEVTQIDVGGETFSNGDGLVLDGQTLYVIQNQQEQISV
ncbi:MAG: hypothetical protein M3220_19210, partial [Chloroflexota bacterium]|nr:hypothetical protein [Chloroflexota bacterium]